MLYEFNAMPASPDKSQLYKIRRRPPTPSTVKQNDPIMREMQKDITECYKERQIAYSHLQHIEDELSSLQFQEENSASISVIQNLNYLITQWF